VACTCERGVLEHDTIKSRCCCCSWRIIIIAAAAAAGRTISFTKIHAPHPVIALKFIRTKSQFIMIHNTLHTEGTRNAAADSYILNKINALCISYRSSKCNVDVKKHTANCLK
jgi:hypothetical protein